jgi:hypothetical protein
VAKQEIPTCKNEFVLGEFFVHLIMITKNELISFRKALIWINTKQFSESDFP